jgi:uroporphyrinogen-III synthase
LDAVVLTSPSTIDHLFSLLGEGEMRKLAKALTLACIGPTTAAHLCEHGIEPHIVCKRQSSAALVAALERWFSEDKHGVS